VDAAVIDLDNLDARLDMALADDLRVQRAQTPCPLPDTGVSPVLPPAPDPAPAQVAPRYGRPTTRAATSRRRSSPTPSSPAGSSPLAPPEGVWDEIDVEQHARAIVNLISQAKLAEADLHIVAHAELARDSRHPGHRSDAAGWAVMRALLAGRETAARASLEEARALDLLDRHPGGKDRHWNQRLAIALTWGDDNERNDVLDQCRERAYCQGDDAWQGRLTLLLAVLGRAGEAGREFDAGINAVLDTSTHDAGWLDLATDLAEAAAVLGDGRRAGLARRGLARVGTASLVVVGRAWVCKGSVARYHALATAAAGEVDVSDGYFRTAAEAHRHLGAEVLLARTLGDWGHSLAHLDPQRGAQLRREGTELSHRLGLSAGHPAFADVA